MTDINPKKEEYAKAVCMFLAEMLRTRKVSLARSAEIAQKVVDNINLIDTEEDFLRLIKELTSDFEELFKLQKIVLLDVERSQRRDMEETVREYVINIMGTDARQALDVLVEAVKAESQLPQLCAKFPKLKEFTEAKQ
jgi:hypothetical protein